MPARRLGSLCTGYGGLDAAAGLVTGASLAWVADSDKDVSALLAARYPGVPNLGDIAMVDWPSVEPVQVLCAGFPCQDLSCAGRREGLIPGNKSGTWYHVYDAISFLRPELVIIENVRGICAAAARSGVESCEICLGDKSASALRALGAVLGDLSSLGFDAEWANISAADAGSCHKRERIFIVAWPAAQDADRATGRQRRLAAS